MSHFLAIDAGLRGCGAAAFKDGFLVKASYIKNPDRTGTGIQAWEPLAEAVFLAFCSRVPLPVVVETMRYRPGREKGNPQNILEVQGVAAAIAFRCGRPGEITGYEPQVWKGTVEKSVMTDRILRRLSESECSTIPALAASVLHNVVDACGLGLFHLGRLSPRIRTYAR